MSKADFKTLRKELNQFHHDGIITDDELEVMKMTLDDMSNELDGIGHETFISVGQFLLEVNQQYDKWVTDSPVTTAQLN